MSDPDLFNTSDECDKSDTSIIPPTPVKEMVKTKSKHCKFKTYLSSDFEYRSKTPERLAKHRPNPNTHLAPHLPYIYYRPKEILNFTEHSVPIHNELRTLGLCNQKYSSIHYLTDLRSRQCVKRFKILVDFRLVDTLPNIRNQAIEIFGFLEFVTIGQTCDRVPVLVAQFWAKRDGDLTYYVDMLLHFREFVAADHNIISNTYNIKNETTILATRSKIDSYFEELNDTLLSEAVEDIERLYLNESKK